MNRSRYYIFFSIMGTLLALVWLLVFSELIFPLNLNSKWLSILGLVFISTYALQLYRFAQFKKGNEDQRAVTFTFATMGLFIHLFCAAITKMILMWFPPLQPWEAETSGIFITLAVIFNIKGIHTAMKGPLIKETLVPLPSEFKSLDGLRIVQISDLHVGPVIKEKYVSPIIQQVKALKPDLICFTGDIGDGEAHLYGKELSGFSELQATFGKFFVTGNHEHIWDAEAWMQVVEKLGIKVLTNQGQQILPELFLGGVPDISAKYFSAGMDSDPQKAIQGASGFKVLMAHQPKSCFQAEAVGFDLMLSGHTHNGQFFPFNLLVGLFNPYSKGLNKHGKMQVYVNSGTGFWGPPLRLGVESEVSLLILKSQI